MSKRTLLILSVSAFVLGLGTAFLKDHYSYKRFSVLKALPVKNVRTSTVETVGKVRPKKVVSKKPLKLPEAFKGKNAILDRGKIKLAGANETSDALKRRQAEKEITEEIQKVKKRLSSPKG